MQFIEEKALNTKSENVFQLVNKRTIIPTVLIIALRAN
jgi:hypothetical protein